MSLLLSPQYKQTLSLLSLNWAVVIPMYSNKKASSQSQNKISRVNGPYLEHVVVTIFVFYYVEVGDGELYAAAGSHIYLPHALPLVGVRLRVLRAREHT